MRRVSTKATPYALSRRAPLHLQPNAARLKPLRVMVGALRARRKVKAGRYKYMQKSCASGCQEQAALQLLQAQAEEEAAEEAQHQRYPYA